jgi:hypothetical protein
LAGLSRLYIRGHNMRGRTRPDKSRPLVGRFWSKVDTTGGIFACWPWIGNRTEAGYGQVVVEGLRVGAHRISLEMKLGRPLTDGEMACHTCDNPPCVNPEHLYAGNASTNGTDAWARIRRPRACV